MWSIQRPSSKIESLSKQGGGCLLQHLNKKKGGETEFEAEAISNEEESVLI